MQKIKKRKKKESRALFCEQTETRTYYHQSTLGCDSLRQGTAELISGPIPKGKVI